MRHKLVIAPIVAGVVAGLVGLSAQTAKADNYKVVKGVIPQSLTGKAGDAKKGRVAFKHRKKGNCLACHMIAGGNLPGNIGPPLVAMKARFPNKANLRAQIWDPTVANPNTIMPPFGKHRVLSDKEVDLVTEFIYSL